MLHLCASFEIFWCGILFSVFVVQSRVIINVIHMQHVSKKDHAYFNMPFLSFRFEYAPHQHVIFKFSRFKKIVLFKVMLFVLLIFIKAIKSIQYSTLASSQKLTVLASIVEPFVIYDKETSKLSGLDIDIVTNFAKKINLQVQLNLSKLC